MLRTKAAGDDPGAAGADKRGAKTKRLKAAWDEAYLLKVIGLIHCDPTTTQSLD